MSVYRCKDITLNENDSLSEKSEFDNLLQTKWQDAMDCGIFRYKLKILETKRVAGRYSFFAQLNPERHTNRRAAFTYESVKEAFQPDQFNFLRVKPEEVLIYIEDEESNMKGSVIINISPFEFCSSLVVPSPEQCLNQTITEEGLHLVLQLMKQSSSLDIRVAYNSLLAYASVNHQHYHIYYFPFRMFLESAEVSRFNGDCFLLEDFPSKGLCFQVGDTNYTAVIRNVCKLANYMCDENIAHSMWITKGRSCSGDTDNNVIRLYLWARKATNAVDTIRCCFNPASNSLAGHFVCHDCDGYKDLTEAEASGVLTKTTQTEFEKLKRMLPILIGGH